MKLTFDPAHNIAYLTLREADGGEGMSQVETIRLSDELNVDLAPDSTVYRIEFLNANQQLSGDASNVLTIVNESLGTSTQVKLSA